MKKLEEKFKYISKGVHLTPAEKERMREYLLEYQKMRPLLNQKRNSAFENTFGSSFSFLSIRSAPVFAALILFIVGGAGVSFAAGNALPGDTLYPIKVSINEKVEGTFAFSANAKVSYEIALANRRLSEAEALAGTGTLSAPVEEELEAGFTAHARNAKNDIAQMAGTMPDSALVSKTKLDAILRTHADILAGGVSANSAEKSNLIAAIDSEDSDDGASAAAPASIPKKTSSPRRPVGANSPQPLSASSGETTLADTASMKKAAEHSYAATLKTVEQLWSKLSADGKLSAHASLSAAEALIADGNRELGLGTGDSLKAAFDDYQKALAAEEELMLRVTSNASIQEPRSITPRVLEDFAGSSATLDVSGSVSNKGERGDSENGSVETIREKVRGILDMVHADTPADTPPESDTLISPH